MRICKLSEIADIQTGLVLNRQSAEEKEAKYHYQRLNLRALTEGSLLDSSSFESYHTYKPVDDTFLTKENDIIIRLYFPVCTTLITKENAGLVVPSQLAIIRIKDDNSILPGYLSAFLSNERSLENMIEGAGMMAQKIIKVGNISELQIPCLPFERQRIISDISQNQLKLNAIYKKIIEQETVRTKTIIKDIIGGKR